MDGRITRYLKYEGQERAEVEESIRCRVCRLAKNQSGRGLSSLQHYCGPSPIEGLHRYRRNSAQAEAVDSPNTGSSTEVAAGGEYAGSILEENRFLGLLSWSGIQSPNEFGFNPPILH